MKREITFCDRCEKEVESTVKPVEATNGMSGDPNAITVRAVFTHHRSSERSCDLCHDCQVEMVEHLLNMIRFQKV